MPNYKLTYHDITIFLGTPYFWEFRGSVFKCQGIEVALNVHVCCGLIFKSTNYFFYMKNTKSINSSDPFFMKNTKCYGRKTTTT